ncbi:MAG TPA: VWA domain-containing protein [Streptosporangiaceae bacterium]
MSIGSPALLAIGLVITAALGWATVVFSRRRAAALAAAGVAVPGRRRRTGLWLTIAGIGVLAIAVAGPAASIPEPRNTGTIMVAVDVSGSMGAKDVAPNRLAVAKRAARSLIAAQPGNVNIGVVAFEEGALITARPTADHAQAMAAIDRLAVAGGTSLGSAIVASLSAITGKAIAIGRNGALPNVGYWPSATIVMFTDGQDEGEGTAATTAAALAEKAGVHVDTVGIGTSAGTTVDVDGYQLFTALQPGPLKTIAKTTGGSYHPASSARLIGRLASSISLRLTISARQVPLAGAFIVLALVLLCAGAAATITSTGRVI